MLLRVKIVGILLVWFSVVSVSLAADITLYCKCSCPPHVSRVLTVNKCTLCTKTFCVEQQVCPNITKVVTTTTSSLLQQTATVTTSALAPTLLPQPLPGEDSERHRALREIVAVVVGKRDVDDDWIAECFQRGSYKDEVVIYIFLVLVVGLLGWAFLKPYFEGTLRRALGYHVL